MRDATDSRQADDERTIWVFEKVYRRKVSGRIKSGMTVIK
jgi:hypothetical protein